jgi:hypothetical protein
MTASILATTDNGDPAFGLKPGTLARKRNLYRVSLSSGLVYRHVRK